jgi:hypothetical protein
MMTCSSAKSLFKNCVVLTVLLVISGCQEIYYIKAHGDPSAPVFEAEKPLYFAAAAAISVSEYDPLTNKTTQIWLIERPQSAEDMLLSRVQYGDLPDGFVTSMPAKPLTPEVVYVVYFRASGGARALGYFMSKRIETTTVLVNVDSHGNPK